MSRKAQLHAAGLLASLVAICMVVWWSVRSERVIGLSDPYSEEETQSEPRHGVEVVHTADHELGRVAVPEAEQENHAPTSEHLLTSHTSGERSSTENSGAIVLNGSITVTSVDGVEHSLESGSMTMILWKEGVGEHLHVEIVDGHWAARLAEEVSLSFADIALGGRRAVWEQEEPLPIPPSRSINVRAQWLPESLLWVRSAETGQALNAIELVRNVYKGATTMDYPGRYDDDDILLSNATVPIDLSMALSGKMRHGQEILFVRAQGHAWKHIRVDLDLGGEHTLDLLPGGDLEVYIAGHPPKNSCLRLRRRDSGGPALLLDYVLRGRREIMLTSIPPGNYTVSIEVGERLRNPIRVGSTPVEVVVGGISQASVELAQIPETERVPLRGVIIIDAAWNDIEPRLTVESIGTLMSGRSFRKTFATEDLQPAPENSSMWGFDAGLVPTGKYEFKIDPPFFLFSHEIDATTNEVRLEIPAPAITAVRTIDSDGAEIRDVIALDWHPRWPKGVAASSIQSVLRDPVTGRFEIRAPSGFIVVSVADSEFRGHDTFELGPGRHEVDLVVSRCVGFKLVLRDNETALPWQETWDLTAREVNGNGRDEEWIRGKQEMRIVVTRPGLYRVSIPEIDGFMPTPEQEILVPERGFVEHVVKLVRSP